MALLKRKRSGLSDPMSVVTNFVNACNRHDAEGVSACLHPDFDSIQPMYPTRNFRGADQVRRNWQAIFDAEPGFRLTVLRSSAAGDTVWLELHGAGRDAEVAGVFVMGVQGDRIRWARIYSALVEDAPAMTDEETSGQPAPLRQVPPLHADAGWGDGETAAVAPAPAPPLQDDLIAPVVDIDGNGRNRRGRGRRRGGDGAEAAGGATADQPDPAVVAASGPLAAADPVVEEAAAALESAGRDAPEERSTSPRSPADSIDPEALIESERPAPADEPEVVDGPDLSSEPEVTTDPGLWSDSGAGYDFKAADFKAAEFKAAEFTAADFGAADPEGPADVDVTSVVAAIAAEPGPADDAAPLADPGVTVETMVAADPGVVVEPEQPIDAGPDVFVEMSIVEDAVDTEGQALAPEAPPDDAPQAMVPEATAQPGLIVTTPPPAGDLVPDPPSQDQSKRKKRKQR